MARKQYHVIAPANSNTQQTSVIAAPNTANRTFLVIQNTGVNPGFVQFRNAVQNDGSDLLMNAGEILQFDKLFSNDVFNGPTEAINVGSALGTTFAIIEGLRER